jgi:hypothetical protein
MGTKHSVTCGTELPILFTYGLVVAIIHSDKYKFVVVTNNFCICDGIANNNRDLTTRIITSRTYTFFTVGNVKLYK